jgi:hypothetical protein
MSDTLLYYDTQGRGLFLSTGIGDRNWGVYSGSPMAASALRRARLALTPPTAPIWNGAYTLTPPARLAQAPYLNPAGEPRGCSPTEPLRAYLAINTDYS